MGPDGKFVTNFGKNITASECAKVILEEMHKRPQ